LFFNGLALDYLIKAFLLLKPRVPGLGFLSNVYELLLVNCALLLPIKTIIDQSVVHYFSKKLLGLLYRL